MKNFVFVLLFLSFGIAANAQENPEYAAVRRSIDWMWGEHSNPKKAKCIVALVGSNIRGNNSAHQCVVNAIASQQQGDSNMALTWLATGQCHNGAEQALLSKHVNYAIQYTMTQYGGYVPIGTQVVLGTAPVEKVMTTDRPGRNN